MKKKASLHIEETDEDEIKIKIEGRQIDIAFLLISTAIRYPAIFKSVVMAADYLVEHKEE